MKVVVFKNKRKASKFISEIICEEIINNPNLVLCLATGRTMKPVYRQFIKKIYKEKINLNKIHTFNLDEYIGLKQNSREKFRYFMDKNFFNKVKLKNSQISFLNPYASNLKKECDRYENEINKFGGIDLTILGIGRDGHIGFNEPGSGRKSRTRVVKLNKLTRKDNKIFFHSFRKVPKEALTMGIDTIMHSKKIILIAFGRNKNEAVQKAINGKISDEISASFLQNHKDVTIVLDSFAARKLD